MTTRLLTAGLMLCALLAALLCGCEKVASPTENPPESMLTPNLPGKDATKTAAKSEAPAGEAPKCQGQTIGISLLTTTHPFYQDLEKAMRATAEKLNLKLAIVSAEFKASDQDRQMDDFIVEKCAAIVVCPADSASVGGAIKKANQAKIPVFTADISANSGDVVCHIASDNKMGGRLAADYVAKLLGGKGEVLVIDHPAVKSVQDRTAGFEEEMKKYPGIKVVEKAPAEGQRGKAREATANKLISYPNLKGIFGINDDSALGALAACEATKGADKIVIVGYDATAEAKQRIAAGSQLKADVAQFPTQMGITTIETIARYLCGQQVPKVIPIPVAIVDRDSLAKEGKK